ncbi:hypothetical protein R1flu_018475 [Riccia fluitans]|uniref:Uncharacterized protein n=1 Tax=Riccia fluitans TaxID=41844 RepID=A0ABD1ZGY5_9MARC
MTTPKTVAAATKVEETKAAKDIATLPVAVSVVGSMEATKEVAANGKGTHAANGTLTASKVEKAVQTVEELKARATLWGLQTIELQKKMGTDFSALLACGDSKVYLSICTLIVNFLLYTIVL